MKEFIKRLGIFNSILILVLFLAIGITTIGALNKNTSNNTIKNNQEVNTSNIQSDKIEVFVFHNTQRCISCINLGKYAEETIETKFSNEFNSGKIVFKEINLDLPENKELGNKFQASGSSLYINAIKDGKDNISYESKLWMLVTDKQKFIDYLETKIKSLL